ncbi:MAG: hypothetical protein ACYC46_15500 [Acidobacteriaceae bacterium]
MNHMLMHVIQEIYRYVTTISFYSETSLLIVIAIPLLLFSAALRWVKKYMLQRSACENDGNRGPVSAAVGKKAMPDAQRREGWQE